MIRLSVSLFCRKDKWKEILANAITPFLIAHQYPERLLAAYSIEFNQSEGGHIMFSLFTDESNAAKLANKAREYFTAWLLPQAALSGKKASAPFPENTIRFRLYPAKKLTRKENQNHSLSITLSKIILDALDEDDIDDETIFTLAFYLQIGLMKTIKTIDPEFIDTLKPTVRMSLSAPTDLQIFEGKTDQNDFSDNFTHEQYMQERIVLHKKYEEAKEALLEITGDIMQTVNQSGMPGWLEPWLDICKAEIGKSEENIATEYRRIIDTIHMHLGITQFIDTMLAYFVGRVFGLMNPPNAIIMGAAKCGTTNLHHTLLTHSGINGPVDPYNNRPVKEVNFFSPKGNWKHGMDWYFLHFIGSKGIFLDSTPNYLISSVCFTRMQEIIPDARLIICIRDPVYRAYSQYNHFKKRLPASKNWDWMADKDFLTNIKIELHNIEMKMRENDSDLETNFAGLVLRGVYINQINQLLKYYDRSQIYISIMERWPLNYENELDNILTFLGLEKEVLPVITRNNRDYIVEPLDNEAKEILTKFYKPFNKKLFEFLGFEIPEWS